ncbi:MAG TPA: TadE/TadG family type IV pilus assembly protein [Candidatus Limnocylindria bacterium]|nr:TadE/TadG family type IV pilus assembly protein [Candidatus Limnocylindria bacterium]
MQLHGHAPRPRPSRATRRPLRPDGRGQAYVEFAIILPLLLLLVTGIMQFGILLSGQIALVNGVREAARFGSVLQTGSSAAVANDGPAVRGQLDSVLVGGMPAYDPARLTASSACYVGYLNPNSNPPSYSVRLTVSATYRHALFIPIIAQLLDLLDGVADSGFTLTASESFRVENPPLGPPNPLTAQVCG